MIYDQEFIKQLPEQKQFENPWVVGICKMKHNETLKELIEKWFLAIPEKDRPKLLKRLRSQDDYEFIPALYELVIHQFCVEEGWNVEYEPTLSGGGTPDLQVTTSSGYKFILDVTTIFDSDDFTKLNNKKTELTHQISAIKTDWFLRLHYLALPSDSAKPKAVTTEVSKWLSGLVDDKDKPSKIFNLAGYNLEVIASKNEELKPKGGCVISVMDPGMSVPDYSNRIKSALDDKRSKYSSKKTNLPLVVMVGDAGGLVRTDEQAIDKTLFGQHQLSISVGADKDEEAKFQRDRSGYFTPSNSENGEWSGKNTGLSAVMYASIKEQGSFQMQVFHNPVPLIPLDPNLFSKMAQLIVFERLPNITMRWVITDPENKRIHFS